MVKKYSKLHLDDEQLDVLIGVLESYDWLCDCPEFPNCHDFQLFLKLKERVKKLSWRSAIHRIDGVMAMRELKRKHMIQGYKELSKFRRPADGEIEYEAGKLAGG